MKIVLVGYMGSGKTTVGKELSKYLGFRFLDLDAYIEDRTGMKIAAIFMEKGEIFFRKLEHQYLLEVLENNSDIILSTGGGTPCYSGNMEVISRHTENVFYLRVSIPVLVKRLSKEKSHRPLIAHIEDRDLPEFFGKHIFERSLFYSLAAHTIPSDGTPQDIAMAIKSHLR
ncbi:shikimate kinase [Flavobacteriaceae bacterium KMM 6897]|nr:shikimate kinase [Flavobacteriaceae bacterium KMM 6897]MEB8347471.1 shikimate kinase [Flavobacteriaceae bacterium KMM 6898]